MPAQYLTGWNPVIRVVVHQALVTRASAGAGSPKLKIYTVADLLLGTIILSDPIGTVDGTGKITCIQDTAEASAPNSGTASYASLEDGDGVVMKSVPCKQGVVPEVGYCVLNAINIGAGVEIALVSLIIE